MHRRGTRVSMGHRLRPGHGLRQRHAGRPGVRPPERHVRVVDCLSLSVLSLLGRGDNLFFKKKNRGTTKREARTNKREVEARPQFGTTNGEATSFGRPIENIFGGLRVGTTRREGGGRGDDQYTCFGQRTTRREGGGRKDD